MSTLRARLAAIRRRVRRVVLARRRLLAALFAAAAVVAGLRAVSPPPPETVVMLTAARDLPAGVVLTGSDLRQVAVDPRLKPDGTASRPVGRTLASPLRRGEPVTDRRLVAAGLLEGYPGLVALPVRIPDAGAVALLRVGDRIDLIAADPQGATAATVASRVPVLALPAAVPEQSGQAVPGALVVLGVRSTMADEIALAGATQFLAVSWSR